MNGCGCTAAACSYLYRVYSLIPRPPLADFFGAMGNVCFSTAAKKSARGGMDTRLYRVHM